MLTIAQFIVGMVMCCWMSKLIDNYDDYTGRRLGASVDGYGSNISYTWRNFVASIGSLAMMTAPITFFYVLR